MQEDAALTDIGRIGLEPLSEKEVHNSLTDLVANRVNLSPYQRYQLRQNIGQGFSISNVPYIKKQLTALGYGDVSGYEDMSGKLNKYKSGWNKVWPLFKQKIGQLDELKSSYDDAKAKEGEYLAEIDKLKKAQAQDGEYLGG